eukprot:4067075-Amphidinium_carterae.1
MNPGKSSNSCSQATKYGAIKPSPLACAKFVFLSIEDFQVRLVCCCAACSAASRSRRCLSNSNSLSLA